MDGPNLKPSISSHPLTAHRHTLPPPPSPLQHYSLLPPAPELGRLGHDKKMLITLMVNEENPPKT